MHSERALQTPGREIQEFRNVLDSCATRLRRALADSEGVFQKMGSAVIDFFGRTQAFSEAAQALAAAMSEGELEEMTDDLAADARRVTESFCRDLSSGCVEGLGGVPALVADIHAHAEIFRRIVKQLQMLGVATRIESVRLGSRSLEFQTLADDVELLAVRIVDDSKAITTSGEALCTVMAKFKQEAQSASTVQQECAETISGELERNLEALRVMHEAFRAASRGLAKQGGDLAENMSEIVASIQSHDIVRQQVEHVAEVLEETVAEVDAQAGARDSAGEMLVWVLEVCTLESAQLEQSRTGFHAAMEEIAARMTRMAGGVADSVRTMSGGGGEADVGGDGACGEAEIVAAVRRGTDRILASLGRYGALTASLGADIESLAATLEDISKNLESIEDISSEIELIALNASVKSARVGEEARALSVVAESIQKLSMVAQDCKEMFTGHMGDLGRVIGEMRDMAAGALDRERVDAFAESQGAILRRLDAFYAERQHAEAEIHGQGVALAQALTDFGAGLDIHHTLCPQFKDAEEKLLEVQAEARRMAERQGLAVGHRSEKLEELLGHYTMDAERMVHQQFTAQEGAESGGAFVAEQDGEWDNIELF
ncbi:methyl-accepting chemotaxis protein [Desulfocurvus sp. DL9XJH121]